MDGERRRAIALFRFGVLGALVGARLEHGDRAALFALAAKHDWVTPDGRVVRISARTIETWYYAHRRGGLSALMPEPREDCGVSRSMTEAVRDLVVRAKRERPRRSIRGSCFRGSSRTRACIGCCRGRGSRRARLVAMRTTTVRLSARA